MDAESKARLRQRVAGYEEVAKVEAHELANLSDEAAKRMITQICSYSDYVLEESVEWSGLVEQQALFHGKPVCYDWKT